MRTASYAFTAKNAFFVIQLNLKVSLFAHIGAICEELRTISDALVATDAQMGVDKVSPF
jgi:hypothetical protein